MRRRFWLVWFSALLAGWAAAFVCPQSGHCFALAAVENIDLRGNTISTDSFDSSDPNYSTGGLYPVGQLNKTKANGNVYTDAALVASLNVGNAKIKGKVRTGPGLNTISLGPNGSVGDRSWVESGSLGIQPGYSATDFNVAFDSVVMPVTGWVPAIKGTYSIDGTNYDYAFLATGDYSIPGLTGSLFVGTNAFVRLQINGNVLLSGQSVIRVAPGGKLRMYMAGSTLSLTSQAWIDTQSHMAADFHLFGLPTCTTIAFGGNADFYGGVYAPQADFLLGAGGNDTLDFVGSSVSKTVTVNGHYNFHFDESLLGPSDSPPWITAQPPSQTITVGQPVAFSVLAGGGQPLSYQWQFAGMDITNATNSSFTIASARPTDAGIYSVIVTNGFGSVVSSNAVLMVNPPSVPNPVLSIAPMSCLAFSNLTLGGVYQLQRSVAWYWSNQPVSFTATNTFHTQMVAGLAGSGDYRLALNPVPSQAFAIPQVVNGFVVGATVTSGGSGYVTVPAVTIVGGGGTNATAVSHISGGVVTSITITSAGIGYTNTPTIRIAPPPAAAISPSVLPVMRLDSASLSPSNNYQIQFKPDFGIPWADWNGGLFSPSEVTNFIYVFITNSVGFFRLQYLP